ncbi:DNA recombination protein RmuC [Oceaniovalibus guishaninsula JLT2003]|uniref:DNA recombination protein RmuC homolog n=1 Tax=Oceaniovalibus guishaninsula JLT2003 TaxID=1231392 RepID=K2HT86_9RHOB|nr:DNA recombination protein RmuC [Oceaniovalibus guishaninsula]EKE45839.1 DNA recombination protein RmuC [Oceaniovalibus guishaninsula JLT2003]
MPLLSPDIVTFAVIALALLALLLGVMWLRANAASVRLRTERDGLARDHHRERDAAAQARARLEGAEADCKAADAARTDALQQVSRLTERIASLEPAVQVMERERDTARSERDGLRDRHSALEVRHKALEVDADGRLASARREVETLTALRETMARQFSDLAGQVLKQTGAELSQSHQSKLAELLTPFREHVGRFETELRKVHGEADKERARLGEQIRHLTQRSEAISTEAVNLTRALKGDKQRQGAWGELILERILEESGLERGTHYLVQEHRRDEEGVAWRPDVVVRMPGDKNLVIDSKVSLVSYEAAIAAETEAERERHMKAHIAAVRRHVDLLSAKGYQTLDSGSVDYVLMFMPIEGAFAEAWRQEGDLASYAISRRVGIATPTTLMVTLRTVDHVWTVDRREHNAEAIADRAGKLYDKLVSFVQSMESVGKSLDSAKAQYDKALGQLTRGSGNAIGQVEKLKAMGARTSKTMTVAHDTDDAEDAPRGKLQAL